MISGCILVKNEQALLPECLESIKELCDEIIVIDNGSTDNTKKIAEEYGCKVTVNTSQEFDLIRNDFQQMASQEWIISIDADERLGKGTTSKIRTTLQNASDDVWGFTVPKLTYSGKGQWTEGNFLEIYRNINDICYTKSSIHASLTPSIEKNGKRIERLDTVMHHVDALVRDTRYKRERYKKLILENLNRSSVEEGEVYYLLCFLGLEYMYDEDWDAAENVLRKALSIFPDGKTMAYTYLSELLYRLGKYDESIGLSSFVINNVKAKNKHAWFNLARNQNALGKIKTACSSLGKFIEFYPTSSSGYYNLAYLLWRQGEEYKDMLNKASLLNEMVLAPEIYEIRPKSIYSNEVSVFDFPEEYLEELKNKEFLV